MRDWTSGYVSDVEYTHGYYTELNPARIEFAMLNAGVVPPKIINACELGFGLGVSINIHAATTDINWYGTDFNSSQANYAKSIAKSIDLNVQLYDHSFNDFCANPDLPNFDYIALHGVWSWISDDNRKIILDFIEKKLNVGGVVYASYNVLPGWSPSMPLRDILVHHADYYGSLGDGTIKKVNSAIDFAERLIKISPNLVANNPEITQRLNDIKSQNKNYVAHEYFNRNWEPMSFVEISKKFQSSKLQWVCSANYLDYIEALNLTDEQQRFLSQIDDRSFKQLVRDYFTNQQFRRDYWIKGPVYINKVEALERLKEVSVVITAPLSEIDLKATGILGEVTLQPEIYNPILNFMSDGIPRKIEEISRAVKKNNVSMEQLLQAITLLIGMGFVSSVWLGKDKINNETMAKKLNNECLNNLQYGSKLDFLASPVTGGGVRITKIPQLFLASISKGIVNIDGMAKYAWDILKSQNQRVVKNGVALDGEYENISELKELASAFTAKHVPMLKLLKIID